jgi:hypothetical protein
VLTPHAIQSNHEELKNRPKKREELEMTYGAVRAKETCYLTTYRLRGGGRGGRKMYHPSSLNI